MSLNPSIIKNHYGEENTYFGNENSTLKRCPKCTFKFGILKTVNGLSHCYCMNNYCCYNFGLFYSPDAPINTVPIKDLTLLNVKPVLYPPLN